jgi:hypothetical protein
VAERLLREAIDKSPHPKVRGQANFSLANLLESRADMVRDVDKLPLSFKNRVGEVALKRLTSRTADDLYGESEALYGCVANTCPDLEHSRTGKTLGAVALGRAYRVRNLAVGRAVPEIEGVDVDGEPPKLSDHRGDVMPAALTTSVTGEHPSACPQIAQPRWNGLTIERSTSIFLEPRKLLNRLSDYP